MRRAHPSTPRGRLTPHILIVCLSAAVLGALAAVACNGGDGPSATPTPSVAAGSPAPTATPTPPPPDPTLADRLRYRGDFEEAAGVYASVAAVSTSEEAAEARLGQAQMLLRADEPGAARFALEAYVLAAGSRFEGSTGQFLLASTLDDMGEDVAAGDLYARYVAAGGPLRGYANIERAKLLAALSRGVEAEQAASIVLNDPEVADLVGSFSFSMGQAYAAAGLDASALAWFTQAQAYSDFRASALAGAGGAKQRLGDATWASDYILAITIAPASGEAVTLLDELDVAGVVVGDYTRGLVEYRAFRNTAARASMERAVAASDRPGEALYYLGALDERAGDDASAIARYQQSYETDPASSQADSALWWRGRLLENAARYDEASATYGTLAAQYPVSDWAEGAAFRAGLVKYKAGDLTGAAATWGALASQEDSEGYRARLWQGKALSQAEDPLGEAVLRQLADDPEGREDYYGIRAAALLGEELEAPDDPDLELSPDWEAIELAIIPTPPPSTLDATPTATATATSAPMPVDLDADARWARAAELDAVGLRSLAGDLRSEIIADAGGDERVLLAVTRRFFEEGDESYAARAAATLLSVLPDDVEPPRDLVRLAYPPAFGELVLEAAGEQGLEDPLVLFALMRQESLYDPDAGSIAGALGLTQVIPPTGEAIAEALGVTDFEPSDLFRPAVSLRFGANYIAGQLEQFEGNMHYALAAYNGGPGATLDAQALAGDDLDLFVEELEFEETRLYVRLVIEHYARYVEAYEDEGR
jgi:soluble lytic murein transglycosylase